LPSPPLCAGWWPYRKDLSHPIAGFSEGNPEVRIDLLSVPGEMLEVRQALANGVASRLSEL